MYISEEVLVIGVLYIVTQKVAVLDLVLKLRFKTFQSGAQSQNFSIGFSVKNQKLGLAYLLYTMY